MDFSCRTNAIRLTLFLKNGLSVVASRNLPTIATCLAELLLEQLYRLVLPKNLFAKNIKGNRNQIEKRCNEDEYAR